MSIPDGVECTTLENRDWLARITEDERAAAIKGARALLLERQRKGFKKRGGPGTFTDPAARFFSHVAFGADGCWRWTGGLARGYAKFTITGYADRLGHRWAYRWFRGEIPAGYLPHHVCEQKACVNPDHLVLVTHSEHALLHDAGKKTGARNQAKTHCPHGHEYNEANTYHGRRGRGCRACAREKWREKNDYGRPRAKLHCPQGHPYDDANTYVTPRGHRQCRLCRLESQRRHYARKRANDVDTRGH